MIGPFEQAESPRPSSSNSPGSRSTLENSAHLISAPSGFQNALSAQRFCQGCEFLPMNKFPWAAILG